MRSAFSLVELSIVLVILGLLTGGILAGQSLIRASELRSVSTDLNRFHTATHAFRDKFFALPGDMANATSFWGEAHATPTTCRATASTGTLTCNGDGSGTIISLDGSTLSESFHYWVHLANAGLLEGKYTGIKTAAAMESSTAGSNVPASRLSAGGYSMRHCASGCWMGAAQSGKNVLFFGGLDGTGPASGGILTGSEAWNIDTKIDDGLSQRGRLTVQQLGNAACDTGAWVLSNSSRACSIIWTMP